MLNPIEFRLLSILVKRDAYLNTTEIARLCKISWNTAQKYLEEMHGRGWLDKKGQTKMYWKAIFKEGGKDE